MVGGDPGGAGGVWGAGCHHTELYQPYVKRPGYLFFNCMFYQLFRV